MTALLQTWLPLIARTTATLTIAVLVASVVLRLARVTSPTIHRWCWTIALLMGWTFFRLSLNLPWLDPAAAPAIPDLAVLDATAYSKLATEEAPLQPQLVELHAAAATSTDDSPLARAQTASSPTVLEDTSAQEFAQAAAPAPAMMRPIDWRLAAFAVWTMGILSAITAWLVGYWAFVRRLPAGETVDAAWSSQWRDVLAEHGVARSIRLRVTANIGPMLCRLPSGYELLVPGELWRELSEEQREAILRHELAHYQRGDVWKSFAVRLLALPHWFNPLAWLAVRRFDEAAEWACDLAATAQVPATSYAAALVRLTEHNGQHASYSAAAGGRRLAGRVRRLLKNSNDKDSTMKKSLVVLAALCVVAVALVRVELVAKEPTADVSEVSALVEAPAKSPAEVPGNTPAEAKATGTNVQFAPEAPADLNAAQQAPPARPGVTAPAPPAGAPQAVRIEIAEPELIATARRGFEASKAAYESDTITLDQVCAWSLRLLEAEQTAQRTREFRRTTPMGEIVELRPSAPTGIERLAAVESHLERMRPLQAKVKVMYEMGTRGGEAEKMALMNYLVADAERQIAAMTAPAAENLEFKPYPSGAPIAPPGAVPLAPPRAPGTKVEVPTLGPQPSAQFPTRQYPNPPQPTPVPSSTPIPSASTASTAPQPLALKSKLRYDGKPIETWIDLLQTELSPERRSEAIHALVAFGEHGFARQSADAIVRMMSEFDVRRANDGSPTGKLILAAVDAMDKLPRAVSQEVLQATLQANDPEQRAFAVKSVALLSPPRTEESLQQVLHATQDPNDRVRAVALQSLGVFQSNAPQVAEALRRALKDSDAEVVRAAIGVMQPGSRFMTSPVDDAKAAALALRELPDYIPDLLNALSSAHPSARNDAANALLKYGVRSEMWTNRLVELLKAEPELAQRAAQLLALQILSGVPDGRRLLMEEGKDFVDALKEERGFVMLRKALSHIGPKVGSVATSVLVEIAGVGPDKALRLEAIEAFGRLGDNALNYLNVLHVVVDNSSDPEIAAAAKKALKTLQPQPAVPAR